MSALAKALNDKELARIVRGLSRAKTEERVLALLGDSEAYLAKKRRQEQMWAEFFEANPEAGL